MKQLKLIYPLLLTLVLPLMTACYNDDAAIKENPNDGKVTVRLRVSQATPATTRAFQDDKAEEKEMMNIWTVVAVKDATNEVVGIWSCKPQTDSEKEIDDIEEIATTLDKNTKYRFYSFANMAATNLGTLLGLSDKIPTPTDNGEIVSATADLTNCTLTKDVVESIAVKVEGNGFDKFRSDDNNGFGYYGIPMSNVQTFKSLNNGDIKDLIVVRMLAKIKLEITNSSAEPVTITSIAITDITTNGENNLKLFPKYNNSDNANTMEAVHGDIEPNLNGNPETDEMTVSVNKTINRDEKEDIIFYINESQTPTSNPKNNYNHFFLKINLSKNNGTQTEKRYTLIDDSNAEDYTGKWDYIARNDYRIIPIVLDDYKLELIPYDFPAIGVYPASVKEEDGLYTITFHDYGHFHLLPKVTKFTTEGAVTVSYGTEGWSLNEGNFSTAWQSWNDHTKTSNSEVASFYAKTDNIADTDGNATINDADDAGGIPVWYDNGASVTPWNKSQWDPTGGTNYQPFIFGYIADPGESIKSGDKKVYHEFTIKVNTNHLLTYRLYMILDQDQMLYRSRALDAPAARHTHHGPHI